MPCCRKIPETVDKDLDDDAFCVDAIKKSLAHLDRHITETLTLYQSLVLSHERVSQSYLELSQRGTAASREFVRGLARGVTALREGKGIGTLQGSMGRQVRERYKAIVQQQEKVHKMSKGVRDEKLSYDKQRDAITRMEKSYAKKNKVLSESKSYGKMCKKRDETKTSYTTKKMAFATALDKLKESVGSFAIDTFQAYVSTSSTFAKFMGEEMERQLKEVNQKAYLSGEDTSETISVHSHRDKTRGKKRLTKCQ